MLERLRVLIKAGRYRVTLHAEQERDADQILTSEIEEAFTDRESVVLEDYPDDPRGHSALVLGFTKAMEPLHGVWSIHEKTAILVNLPTGSKIVDQLAKVEGEVNMKSCPFCKAPLKRKTIEHVHRWGGRLFLFKNIRAEVCSQCGETFLKPAVLRLMDTCTSSGKVGKARISIPVISVPLKVSA